MKRLYWLIPAALLLTACDRKSAPDAFTPEMASFSNEFEFDPLRGPVKDFSQTLLDEHDVVVKKVSAQLSREGCFDLLTLEDVENKTGATLLLDANYYVDGRHPREAAAPAGQVSAGGDACRRGELGDG
ncbi:unnamed protein product [Klebsiella pneumoniae subsp. rhinoscleromatis SB3432]|uniref:Lipoprotein ynfC n=1 Tax=Klebsiella pneumoniae TaxID=573 RepID=A0A377XAD1_KLEPN|nr:unnamed protein product [Klebsiella pneumoniae subsp. rhinoscleromatis SB3432]STT66485.1 lipoprotein ynfC [Klebsiella pneumoniae]STV50005.1 lipoprotein ynfC [Klebsiella pneumoniae subsp. rhinoscleromatis]STT72926.1 lipoprotein ynfC [Klebsiella pneumoniae]STU48409.1 lipoprotein ynfC [Klebsiella pneumoniae]